MFLWLWELKYQSTFFFGFQLSSCDKISPLIEICFLRFALVDVFGWYSTANGSLFSAVNYYPAEQKTTENRKLFQ